MEFPTLPHIEKKNRALIELNKLASAKNMSDLMQLARHFSDTVHT